SNWGASTSGEAIATYKKNILLYPNRAPFTATITGSATITDTVAGSSVTGYQAVLAAAASGTNVVEITWQMTGEAFNLVFTAVSEDAWSYEVLVDGVSIGTFNTAPN